MSDQGEDDIGDPLDLGIVGGETELGKALENAITRFFGTTPSVTESNKKPELIALMCDMTFFTSAAVDVRSLVSEFNRGPLQTNVWVDIAAADAPLCEELRRFKSGAVCVRGNLNPGAANLFEGETLKVHVMHEPDGDLWVYLTRFLKSCVGAAGTLSVSVRG